MNREHWEFFKKWFSSVQFTNYSEKLYNSYKKYSHNMLSSKHDTGIINFIQLHFKLLNGVNVFIVGFFLLYQTPTTGSTMQCGRCLIK